MTRKTTRRKSTRAAQDADADAPVQPVRKRPRARLSWAKQPLVLRTSVARHTVFVSKCGRYRLELVSSGYLARKYRQPQDCWLAMTRQATDQIRWIVIGTRKTRRAAEHVCREHLLGAV